MEIRQGWWLYTINNRILIHISSHRTIKKIQVIHILYMYRNWWYYFRMTKDLLSLSQKKTNELEKTILHQKSLLRNSSHQIENLEIFLSIKDKKIKDLNDELHHGKAKLDLQHLRCRVFQKGSINFSNLYLL